MTDGASTSSRISQVQSPSKSPRLHYAWVVAGLTFAILLATGGIRGTSGILVVPLENDFHWSRGAVSFAIGVNLLLYGLVGPFAAALMETVGLRGTVLGALATVSTGLLLTTFMQYDWQLTLLWGVLIGGGTGVTANVFAATVATRWFAQRRGLVTGVLASAAAAGQLIFLPTLAELQVAHGWRWMSVGIAMVTILLIPLVAILMRDRPSDIGLAPYGEQPATLRTPDHRRRSKPLAVAFEALGLAARSRDFWLIAGSIFICGGSTAGLIGTHLIPACVDHGIPEVTAASLLAGMALFNVVGTTASGWLSDRIDPRLLLVTYYGLRGISLIYLPSAFDSFFGLSVFSVFYGLDWLASIPATIRITADRFGAARAGLVFGWVMAVHQIGSAFAAYIAGALRMDFGNYQQAFWLSGMLCFLASFMVMFIRGSEGPSSGERISV